MGGGNAMQIVDTKENIMLSKRNPEIRGWINPIACIITAMVQMRN
jgi:hypothetical protein